MSDDKVDWGLLHATLMAFAEWCEEHYDARSLGSVVGLTPEQAEGWDTFLAYMPTAIRGYMGSGAIDDHAPRDDASTGRTT